MDSANMLLRYVTTVERVIKSNVQCSNLKSSSLLLVCYVDFKILMCHKIPFVHIKGS